MEPARLGELIDRHGAALALYARQWCATPEDVVQESLLRLAGLAVAPHEPLAWLYRSVRNAAISAGRSERRRTRRETHRAAQNAPWFEPSAAADLDAEMATAALQQLPLDQREVIVAHLWGGLTFEQIAGVAGSSASTLWRRYTAGLTALRQHLGVSCPPTTEPTPKPA